MSVIVIGAGLAGLTAARTLKREGLKLRVLEACSEVGGRVRTRQLEGFSLDRGFQVLFTAYPAVRRQLDLAALDLVMIPPAAVIREGNFKERVGDPLRDLPSLLSTLTARSFTLSDQLLVLRLASLLTGDEPHKLLVGPDETTLAFLQRFGFSQRALRRFFAPFFGGIFLNRDLSTSARLFRYYFRMLLDGQAALPRGGMGKISAQLAAELDVQTDTRVERLEPRDGSVTVYTGKGALEAERVIVAAHPPEIERLTGVKVSTEGLASSYLYYASEEQLDDEPRLILNAEAGLINNVHWSSNTDRTLAPAGRHLLSVTVLGSPAQDDDTLDEAVRQELARWYGSGAAGLRLLRVDRISFAQYEQPPGVAERLPSAVTPLPNVYLASEVTTMSSIQGALESGEKAAAYVLGKADLRPRGA